MNFQIIRSLGSGTFGNVYMIRDRNDHSEYAVKCIAYANAKERQQARHEYEILKQCNHPNILQCFKCWDQKMLQSSSYLCIQMELCHHMNLRAWLNVHDVSKRLPWISQICMEIIEAVYYIHNTMHLIHRDLKPENILFSRDPIERKIKIADFGLATYHQNHQGTPKKHRRGVGTPYYMAPEVMHGTEYDESADIYSLGVIFFEMYIHNVASNRSQQQFIYPMAFIDNHPIEYERIKRMLSREPSKRPTAIQLKEELAIST